MTKQETIKEVLRLTRCGKDARVYKIDKGFSVTTDRSEKLSYPCYDFDGRTNRNEWKAQGIGHQLTEMLKWTNFFSNCLYKETSIEQHLKHEPMTIYIDGSYYTGKERLKGFFKAQLRTDKNNNKYYRGVSFTEYETGAVYEIWQETPGNDLFRWDKYSRTLAVATAKVKAKISSY